MEAEGTVEMEALRTRIDSLQWELNKLDVENKRLRDGDPETAARLDAEEELQRTKEDARKLEERAQQAERDAEEAAGRASELSAQLEENKQELENQQRRAVDAEANMAQVTEDLAEVRRQLAAAKERVDLLRAEKMERYDELDKEKRK